MNLIVHLRRILCTKSGSSMINGVNASYPDRSSLTVEEARRGVDSQLNTVL